MHVGLRYLLHKYWNNAMLLRCFSLTFNHFQSQFDFSVIEMDPSVLSLFLFLLYLLH